MSSQNKKKKVIFSVIIALIVVVCFIFFVPVKFDVPVREDEVIIGDWIDGVSSEIKNTCLEKESGRLGEHGSAMTCYQLRRKNVSLWEWWTSARHTYEPGADKT